MLCPNTKRKTPQMFDHWDTSELPGKPRKELLHPVRFLWHSKYYDFAKSGMCMVNGHKLWFEDFDEKYVWIDMDDDEDRDFIRVRLFHAIELTKEQLAWQQQKHSMFQALVGTHCNYDKYGRRCISDPKPEETCRQYCEIMKCDNSRFVIKPDQIVGYFSEHDVIRIHWSYEEL